MHFKLAFLFLSTLVAVGLVDAQQIQRPKIPPRPGVSPAVAAKYALEVTGSRHVVGEWRTKVYTSKFPADEWMLFFPAAQILSRQTGVKTTMTPPGQMLKEISRSQRPYLALRVGPTDGSTPQEIDVAVRYEATLLARRLVDIRPGVAPPMVPPLNMQEKFGYLASTATLDFRAEPFQAWLDDSKLRRQTGEDDVQLGRRVFETMTQLFAYRDGVAIRPASKLYDLAELDCDTFSTVFVSALRANQAPARVLFAWPARTIRPDAKGMISGHALAEFFAAGTGWVPVDLANAAAARAKGKAFAHYFGDDDGTHLVAQIDPDYIVPTPPGPTRIDSMHPGPSVWTRAAQKADVRFRPQIWEVTEGAR